jgi:hypothetical protein
VDESFRGQTEEGAVRRVAALAAILAGLAIAVSPFALSLAGNVNGGQRMTDRFRSTLSTQGLAQLKSSFTTTTEMGTQFLGQTLPDVQRRFHESPAAFRSEVRTRYPAIATAEREVPPVVALVKPKVPGLLGIHDDFQKVDSLPLLGLPISSVPWLLFALGAAVVVLGVVVLLKPTRSGAVLVAVTGVALIIAPFALSLPSKADATVRVDHAGRFVFSPKIAPAALATTERIDRLVAEVHNKFVPQTAARLHESPTKLNAQLAHSYPAVARGLAAWPSIYPGALQRARDQVASERDFANVDGIDVRAVPWAVIGPGILMLLGGAVALIFIRPRRTGGTCY